jgi:hypothetical protein
MRRATKPGAGQALAEALGEGDAAAFATQYRGLVEMFRGNYDGAGRMLAATAAAHRQLGQHGSRRRSVVIIKDHVVPRPANRACLRVGCNGLVPRLSNIPT